MEKMGKQEGSDAGKSEILILGFKLESVMIGYKYFKIY